jgi:hypothetical protein
VSLLRWREDRQAKDDAAVLAAIRMLRPSQSTGGAIIRLAYLSPGRAYVALGRLEKAGRITSEWAPGEALRRRLYKVASPAVVGR